MNIETTRDRFEERAFAQRYIKSIRRVGISDGAFAPVDCPSKADFIRRNQGGDYLDPTLAAMWWAWSESVTQLTSTIPAAAKQAIDTLRQQFGHANVCCGCFVEGYGGDGMLQPPDPPSCCGQYEENVGMLLDVVTEGFKR